MKTSLYILCFLTGVLSFGQDSLTETLTFDSYLALVKANHPVAKQAQLVIDQSQANVLRSRGAFDPRLEVDYDRKKFKDVEYYDKLNATFKIPTWFGVELKGDFEQATGDFLNPENVLPQDGLYSAGVSFSVAQGLLINERMAALKQARLFEKQAQADRDILVNTVLYEASLAYFNWLQTYNEVAVYANFLRNADFRFQGIKQSVEIGDLAPIDSIEARIVVNDRKLKHEQAKVKYMKASLSLSNFLWLGDNIPVELQDNVIPDLASNLVVDAALGISELQQANFDLETHPKLQSLNYKYQGLEVDRRLKANKLLPQIDLEYNFLSENINSTNNFNTANYKSGLSVRFPIFLRKERGDLKLAKLKIRDTKFEISTTELSLTNKIDAIRQEINSFQLQNDILNTIVSDYDQLLKAEDRKFAIGESSVFLVNSRETKLIEAQLNAIALQNSILSTKAKLFNVLAINPSL